MQYETCGQNPQCWKPCKGSKIPARTFTGAFAGGLRKSAIALFLTLAAWFAAMPVLAQSVAQQGLDKATEVDETSFGFRQGSVIVAPIPLSNPTFGSGLVLAAGYLFNIDESSDTSFFGLGGMRTDNGTSGYALMGNFALSENTWKFGFSAGSVDAFYDLYILGVPIPINQSGDLITADIAYGLTRDISVGIDLRYIETKIGLRNFPGSPIPLDRDLGIFNFGLNFDVDYRDDTIFPSDGTHLAFKVSQGVVVKGGDREYLKTTLVADQYWPVRTNDVVALRVATCVTSSNAPFYDSCSLGGVDKFRGYSAMQFFDDNLISAQIEYRGRITKKLGYTAFAGIGAVASNYSDLFSVANQSAGGLGLRYRLSKKFPLDFSVDTAFNAEGDMTTYVYLGQRF